MQKKINKEEQQSSPELQDLKEELAEIKKGKSTRFVRLWYSSCCGCGCDDVLIVREVPTDSELQDYDMAGSFQENDEFLEDWEEEHGNFDDQ